MAGASLLTLLDDIATVLDDVALMTKVAAKKTAGVLGDDLALNAEQVSGVRAERELPVVWAVAVGSLKNKLILVPLALGLSVLAPWAISPLLMAGGAYLCFEGFEKLAHKYLHTEAENHAERAQLDEAAANPDVDLVAYEKDKIKGAIRTDFVLSGEIIVITLGTVAKEVFLTQVIVLTGVGLIMTVGVYGFVALIVKLDDIGFYLKRTADNPVTGLRNRIGNAFLAFAPRLMKSLTVIGTLAMFLVGGSILTHGLLPHEWMSSAEESVAAIPGVGVLLRALVPSAMNIVAGVLAGALVLAGVALVSKISSRFSRKAS